MNQTSSKVIAKWISQNFPALFAVESTNGKSENNSLGVIGNYFLWNLLNF